MSLLGWIIATGLVLITIGIHYEIMRLVSDYVIPWAMKRFHDRRTMTLMIGSLIFGHILEIWVFGLALSAMALMPELGHLSGDFDGTWDAFLYFSAVNYTSLGYGDILPHGALRSVAVSEALAGLMMIAWSASFTYLKMEQIWALRHKKDARQ